MKKTPTDDHKKLEYVIARIAQSMEMTVEECEYLKSLISDLAKSEDPHLNNMDWFALSSIMDKLYESYSHTT